MRSKVWLKVVEPSVTQQERFPFSEERTLFSLVYLLAQNAGRSHVPHPRRRFDERWRRLASLLAVREQCYGFESRDNEIVLNHGTLIQQWANHSGENLSGLVGRCADIGQRNPGVRREYHRGRRFMLQIFLPKETSTR